MLCALSGNATFSRMCFSCQLTCIFTSTRGTPAYIVMSCVNVEFWKCFFTRITARSGLCSRSLTSSALSRSQCCFSKSASMFQASHCLGLSTKVCSRFPQIEFLGPPVSVSAGASASAPLRLSTRLVTHPDAVSSLRRTNSFSRESAADFTPL